MENDSSSFDTDADYEWLALSIANAVVQIDYTLGTEDGGGRSRSGRAPNQDFKRPVAKQRLHLNFIRCASSAPLFLTKELELAFRLPCVVYKAIRRKVVAQNQFSKQRKDAI